MICWIVFLNSNYWEFPGSPVVRTPCFHCQEHEFWSLVRKLRSSKMHMHSEAIKKKKYIYIYIHTHTHTHTYNHIYMELLLPNCVCFGEGNGSPLQCSCLENCRYGGAWWAAVYGVAQSRTRLKWLSSSVCF